MGLVIETRPDEITPEELVWLRKLGVTKVQMGAQSLDDRVLELNLRGHDSAQTLKATALSYGQPALRSYCTGCPIFSGPPLNLTGLDFQRLWRDGFAPDEIKIYPTQLLETAELYKVWQKGEYTHTPPMN